MIHLINAIAPTARTDGGPRARRQIARNVAPRCLLPNLGEADNFLLKALHATRARKPGDERRLDRRERLLTRDATDVTMTGPATGRPIAFRWIDCGGQGGN
jgi:hypothetical protein